jgi:surface antigen
MLAFASLALGACTTTSPLVGAAAPGPATAESIVAALNGGLIGSTLGGQIGARDRQRGLEAEYRALEYTPGGTPVSWKSDDGRLAGSVVAAQPYRVGSQDCRQYTHTIVTAGGEREARGTACRNQNGSWSLLT